MKTKVLTFLKLLLTVLLIISGCSEDENSVSSPVSKFLGKYKSTKPVLVKIKTDFCTFELTDVATIEWDVIWEVKETKDTNIVDIVMTYKSHDFKIINSECTDGAVYLPEPSPLYIKGKISRNNLSIIYDGQEFGTFNFANNEFEGKMTYSYCVAFCQEIYTDDFDFSVQKY